MTDPTAYTGLGEPSDRRQWHGAAAGAWMAAAGWLWLGLAMIVGAAAWLWPLVTAAGLIVCHTALSRTRGQGPSKPRRAAAAGLTAGYLALASWALLALAA